MGATHYRPAFPSRAFRRLLLLFLATLGLFRCDFFDIFPPEIEIVSPEEGTSYFATLPIELKATDNRRVDKVEVFVNGTSVYEFTKSPYKTDISLDQYSAASVNLKAIAHDQAGNSADASLDVNVTIGLRLTAPNGGETWAEQSSQTITWESSGSVGSTVGLHYSTDGGSTWDEITTSTANNGTYTWTLPNFIETQSACKIKVSTSQYADVSDDTFTISAGPNILTLTSPNGGETWLEQSTQTITWTYSGDVGDHVSLDYSIDGGTNWSEIIVSTSNDGSHTWNIPNFLDTQSACRVRVASTSIAFADTSDANFTITAVPNVLTLTAPNGGETWLELSTHNITWTLSGDVGNYVSLHYSLDGGTTWTQIVASTTNNGIYAWTLPEVSEDETTCQVKVVSTSINVADISDANFIIINEHIIVTSPNGGEEWREWSDQTITWDYSGDADTYVSLHYSIDEGLSWSEIESSTLNDKLYEWTLPTIEQTETACKVKVTSLSTSQFDISDGYFTITQWEPVLIGLYDTPGYPQGVFVSGSYAYVADFWYLQIINVSNPASPNLAGSCDVWDNALGVFVSGSYAYVADQWAGLQIINVSDPASPTLAGTYDTPGFVFGVFVSGSYAYVADWDGSLQVINVSNPASPTLAGSYNTPDIANGVYVSGDYAYVADGAKGGLQIVNVSNPAGPTLAGSYDTPGSAHGVYVSGDYAYVADWSSGLQIINVSNPASPTLTGSYNTPGLAKGVFVAGSYAYVADRESGLQVINVSNPAGPALVGTYDTPGEAWDVYVAGSYAYVADYYQSGLLIFDVSELP